MMTEIVLPVANIALGLLLAFYSGRYLRMIAKDDPTRWVKRLQMVIGGAWAALYSFVLVADPLHYDTAWVGATIVRPLVTLTLASLASGAIGRVRKIPSK